MSESGVYLCLGCDSRVGDRICPTCGADVFDGPSMWEEIHG